MTVEAFVLRFITMQGSPMEKHISPNKSEFDALSIKRRDVRNLLRSYNACNHPRMWFRCRQDHISFINGLLATTGAISKKLLVGLTVLAARRDPVVVRKTMVEMLGQSASLVPGQIDTAPLFFQALLESVGNQSFEPDLRRDCKHSKVRMTQWLNLTDPLRIAEDPECGYLEVLKKKGFNCMSSRG